MIAGFAEREYTPSEGMVPGHNYWSDDLRSALEYALTEDFLRMKRTYENISGRSSDGMMPKLFSSNSLISS